MAMCEFWVLTKGGLLMGLSSIGIKSVVDWEARLSETVRA